MIPRGDPREPAAREIQVTGRVQGVGFRYFCRDRAVRLGVTGWVRNEADRSVRIHAEGTDAALDAFVAYLQQGPSAARVSSVEARSVSPMGTFTSFTVEY